ncbi:UNVERIFIED_ORG: putative transcriptional regulator [Rhizobium sp. SORGH_AS260]|nr:putative transcriptional regulator [Rhizobium sp. SORGH_AS_0260]
MLTKKGKYGLKALVDLARLPQGETAFVTEIASRNNIPKKFLDTILLELRNSGILRSKKGAKWRLFTVENAVGNHDRPGYPHAGRSSGAHPLRKSHSL